MSSIYLDHAATTPMLDCAIDAMTIQLSKLGNPSSLHTQGRAARKDIEDAREIIAREVGCLASEIIFTGSGTEANNIALKGLFWKRRAEGRNVLLISAIEHHAIIDPAHWLSTHEKAEVIEIPVTRDGIIDCAFVEDFLSKST